MNLFHVVIVISVFLWSVSMDFIHPSRTTSSVNGTTSRIFQERIVTVRAVDSDSSITSLDLFMAKQPERRSEIESIWEWDFWCQLQPKTGNCSKFGLAYFYDAQLDKCFKFMYSGCGGNKNNFNSLVDCERHCKGTTAYMTLKETTRSVICELQPHAGLCLALMDRYHFDVNTHHCKKFVYGGCGGNQNRFTTKNECEHRCRGH